MQVMPDQLSLADKREIDALCDRFESAWAQPNRPAVGDFLRFEGRKRNQLFLELVRLDVYYRKEKGERPVIDEYRRLFPDLAGVLDEFDRTAVAEDQRAPRTTMSEWALVSSEDSAEPVQHRLVGAGTLKIGRHPKLPVCLHDDSKVSAEHAQVEWSASWCRVVDLGSKNGTYVNEVRISEAWLLAGDVLRIGRTQFRIERSE